MVSRMQKCVALATTEAKYVSMSECAEEALFMRHVWCVFLPAYGVPCIKVFEDSQGAIQLAQNPMMTSNLTQIDVRHRNLR